LWRKPAFGLRYALVGVATAWALIAGALWIGGNDLSPSRWPGLITAPPIDQVVAQRPPAHRAHAGAPQHHATARPTTP
jgi:hypothetical protein